MARKRKELNNDDYQSQENLPKTEKEEDFKIITASPKQKQKASKHCSNQELTVKNNNNKNIMLHLADADMQGTCLHSSDSEVMELHKSIKLQKTKRNLFLIKSYSFIDKANNSNKTKNTLKTNAEEYVTKQIDKNSKENKPKKIKKSKSSYDSTEDLSDIQDILRKHERLELPSSKRPLSLPLQPQHGKLSKSKTLDDCDLSSSPVSPPKRESFLRHSFQSIRRSFSSSKKYQQKHSNDNLNNNSNNCDKNVFSSCSASSTTSAGSSSSSSTTSCSFSHKKSKNNNNSNNNQTYAEPRLIKLTVKDNNCVATPHKDAVKTPQNVNTKQQTVAAAAMTATADSFNQQADNLSILNEEDEKDLQQQSCGSSALLYLNKDQATEAAEVTPAEQLEDCCENQR